MNVHAYYFNICTKEYSKKLKVTKKQRGVSGILPALAEFRENHCPLIRNLGHICGCLLY